MHLFDSHVAQDSMTTSAVILDVANSVTEQFPDISRLHLWSDNAGCYKSSDTLLSLFHSRLFSSYDFCEMQDGKGACDRMAATIKSAVRRYVNEGHDVVSPVDFKQVRICSIKRAQQFFFCVVHACVPFLVMSQCPPIRNIQF